MEFEDDFVVEEVVEFTIDGRVFQYKPTTAGEENDWLEEYIETDENGKPKQIVSKINKCKIRNIVSVPYNKDLINKMIGVEKEWNKLDNEEKWQLMSKLKPSTFDKIIVKINSIDKPAEKKT